MVQHGRLGQGRRALRGRGLSHAARLALISLALCLAAAAPAAASHDQESIFEDEHQLLESGPGVAATALDDIDALGADSVRSLVLWSRVAPGRRPARFNAAHPRAYPPAAWDPWSARCSPRG